MELEISFVKVEVDILLWQLAMPAGQLPLGSWTVGPNLTLAD